MGDEGVGRSGQAGADGAYGRGEQRADAAQHGHRVDRRLVPGGLQHGDALAVLHHQHGDGERHHQLDHGRQRPGRRLHHRRGEGKLPQRRRARTGRARHGHRADQQRADQRRHAAAERAAAPTAARKAATIGAGDREVVVQRPHQVEAEPQEHAGHHAHDDRHRHGLHRPPDPAGERRGRGSAHPSRRRRRSPRRRTGVAARGRPAPCPGWSRRSTAARGRPSSCQA